METNIKLNLEEINELLDMLADRHRKEKVDWRLILKIDKAYRRIERRMQRIGA